MATERRTTGAPSPLVGAGLGAAVLAAVLALLNVNYRSYDASNALTLHTEAVHRTLEEIRADLYRGESLRRAYFLSGDRAELERSVRALEQAHARLEEIRSLTADNTAQQARVPLLRDAVDARVREMNDTTARFEAGGLGAVRDLYARGVPNLERSESLLNAMRDEELRLFEQRKAGTHADARRVVIVVVSAILFCFAVLIVLGRRLFTELALRQRSEEQLRSAAANTATLSAALTLFNSSRERSGLLDALLAQLAQTQPFPASAFYAAATWSDELTLRASHAAPPGIARTMPKGRGVVGEAASSGKTLALPLRELDMTLAAGIAAVPPRSVLACPVVTEESCAGVLVVASTEEDSPDRRRVLEQLCAQLAIALRNLDQVDRQLALSEQLRERGEEISRKNAELENANRLKSEFLATMSHELRTPLNAIIGFSETLRDGLLGPLPKEQQEFVTIIFDSGQHLLSLINDVLDLSKIEAGHMALEPAQVNLANLVNSSLAVVRERAMRGRVQLSAQRDEDLRAAVLDERKAKQILFNLLSNAVKFTPEDGAVTLNVRRATAADTEGLRLTRPLSLEEGSALLELRVTDTGIGIDPKDLGRLFRPFVQLESALTRRHGGTGLGLALVDELAALHGGTVGVSSEPGKGSRFSVFLPLRKRLAPADATAAAPRATPTTAPANANAPGTDAGAGARRRVLVVEDDVAAQRLIRGQLESAQFTVEDAETAEDALALARRDPPDLIVLDILLPGMDGWRLLETLRGDARLTHVPVVITSVVADQNRGISLGAFRVFEKPVAKEALLEAIAQLGIKADEKAVALVVDDDPNAVAVVARQLEFRFGTVLRAFGGREAVAIARERHPDLIVLDLMMPEVSGFEVVETLKGSSATADIPVMVLTAKSLSEEDRAQLSGHVQVMMEKSEFNHGRFLNEVRRAMHQRPPVR